MTGRQKNNRLWYTKPAEDWNEGLPIGNGRLAAMVLGYPARERISLNHEWLWRGKNRMRDNEPCSHRLQEARNLLLSGRYAEGTVLANEVFGGKGGVSGEKNRVDPYQPAGDFYFELEHGRVENYERELDLDRGTVSVRYDADGKRIVREAIVHPVLDLIILHISVRHGSFGGLFWLGRIDDPECDLSFSSSGSSVFMDGAFHGGIDFRVAATLKCRNGRVTHESCNKLRVTNAKEILVFIDIGTSAKGGPASDECGRHPFPRMGWNTLLKQHVHEHSRLYGRLTLRVPSQEEDLPTDERLSEYRNGRADPELPLLYFNFSRYLLLSSTAKGELPPNLQGKWNEEIDPPWECDYHHDVNLQMSYWVAEAAHLEESTEALFSHIERFVPHARKAARDLYGCEGVFFPIQTDAWGRSTPESRGWAVWIGAAAWLAQHLWWHYEYRPDHRFLRNRAYPFFKEVAAFYESYLIEDNNGILQIVPSQSPENRFKGGGDSPVTLCVSAAMDVQLCAEVLFHAIQTSELLGVDQEKHDKWKDMANRLPRLKIGSHGQLLEWNEEFEEVEPGHRHMSHLFGLFPGDLITEQGTPELFQAARTSLEQRLAAGGGHTGWSRAWAACLFARFGDGQKAWEHLEALIRDFSTDSLLDLHPPRIFQIDGNLGGAAAIIEMLLRSRSGELHFLPALPQAWPDGKITGLRARGGYSVDLEWRDGSLLAAEVTPLQDGICAVRIDEASYEIRDSRRRLLEHQVEKGRILFPVKAGGRYRITPLADPART